MAYRTSSQMVLRYFTLLILLVCGQLSLAQTTYSILDQNPFSVRHRTLKLQRFPVQIIYPEGLDSLAQVTANSLDRSLAQVGQGMGVSLHPWKVVLQNQGMLSNGFVSLAAPRAEYFMMPPQDPSLIGTNDWINLLAVHESRHMYQNEIGRTGISKWLHYLWGSNGQTAYTNLMIPNWLWEGDAVETETRVTGFGRSVIPQFQMPLRAYLDTYGAPNYAKMLGRSYREYVPNHYVFGQYLTYRLQEKYGHDVIGQLWSKTLNAPSPFSFSRSVKQLTGKSVDAFSRESLGFQANAKAKKIKSPGFTNYLYPVPVSDTSFVALKNGFDVNTQLVLHTPSQERRLVYLGPYFDNAMLAASSQFVVWSEYQYHPRWGQKNQTVFYLYDLLQGKRIKWGSLGQATNPSISADSKYIGALVYRLSGASSLQVIDRESRELVAQLVVKPGEQFVQPRLQGESDFIFVRKKGQSKTIVVWNWKDNILRDSVQLGALNGSHPYLAGQHILFNLPVDGIDQVVRVDPKSNQVNVLTSDKYGAYFGVAQGDKLTYAQYTASGYTVVEGDTAAKKSFQLDIATKVYTGDSIATYPTTTFSKWRIFNPYAWGPLVGAQGNSIDMGIVSKDVLNNLQASFGYQWNANERMANSFARVSYQGFFPVIDFNYESGNRFTELNLPAMNNQFALVSDQWRQSKYSFGVRIPFNLTRSVFQESLEIGSKVDFLQVAGYDLQRRYISEAFNGTYTSVNYQIAYSKLFNRTYRDLQSKWGIQVVGRFNSTPFAQSLQAEIWSIQSKLFFPGFLKHHGFSVRTGYQQESKGNYRFGSNLYFPRGFSYASFDQMFSYSLDYRFPLASTDFNVGRWLYLKRINMDLFADGGQGKVVQKSQALTRDYQSIGVDLSFQVHLMRFSQEFEFGVRGVYLPQTKNFAWYPLVLDIGF